MVEGVVILEIAIAPNGKVDDVRVLRSIPLLDAAAVAAARHRHRESEDFASGLGCSNTQYP